MKLKGVNPIEQHIEKIVLGVVLLLLLGVISMQFVLRPNNVDVGNNRKVSPDQIYTSLESQANQLRSQISDLDPTLPEVKSVDLIERYNQAFASAAGGRTSLSAPLGQGVDIARATGTSIGDIKITSDGPVAALRVPVTSTPIAASQWATLDPYAVVQVPEYSRYVPAQQPFDFPSVTVEASFSGKDLAAALNGENGGSAIPRRFWSTTGVAILGFEAERQKMMPDGSWGASEPIETPPHTPLPTGAIGPEAGLIDLTELVGNAGRAVEEVARPMFPPTIAGSSWTPPSERMDSGDDSEATQIKRLQRQLDRARAELERLTNAPTRTSNPDPRGNPGGGKTGGGIRRDDRRPSTTTQPNRSRDRAQEVRERIRTLEEQLKDLGVDQRDTRQASRSRLSGGDVRSVLEEESVDLWAHDLGVEPGATYRYRTRVVVNNPLFRKGAELDADDADQQALTSDPFARGAWSDWSSPVVAGAREYYFVTNAETTAPLSSAGPKATIELYQMYYGHYRKSTLSVSPGDELATTVRLSGDLLSFDTGVIEAGDAADAVAGLEGEEQSELPEGVSELANRVSIDLGVFVLDVYPALTTAQTGLGQTVTPMRVVLRDDRGEVVVRSDLGDESSLAYALASESASSASDTPLRAPGEPAISPAAELFPPYAP